MSADVTRSCVSVVLLTRQCFKSRITTPRGTLYALQVQVVIGTSRHVQGQHLAHKYSDNSVLAALPHTVTADTAEHRHQVHN
jgi:hypothetical protein